MSESWPSSSFPTRPEVGIRIFFFLLLIIITEIDCSFYTSTIIHQVYKKMFVIGLYLKSINNQEIRVVKILI
jgi:hypothetical protein